MFKIPLNPIKPPFAIFLWFSYGFPMVNFPVMTWNLRFCCPTAALPTYKSLQGTVGPWLTKQLA